jgi:hypothetical protein
MLTEQDVWRAIEQAKRIADRIDERWAEALKCASCALIVEGFLTGKEPLGQVHERHRGCRRSCLPVSSFFSPLASALDLLGFGYRDESALSF